MAPGCIMGRRQAGGGSVMVFPCICALFQQDVSCHTVKIGLKNMTKSLIVDLASKFPDLHLIQHLWDGPTLQLTGLKGSTANVLVPDTTGHLQSSCKVHGSMRGTYTILGFVIMADRCIFK